MTKDAKAADDKRQISSLARQLMQLARDTIVVNLRFFDGAVFALPATQREGLFGGATIESGFVYDPAWLLARSKSEPAFALRLYLHSLLHMIFHHEFGYDKLDAQLWDIAVDLAVENTILELSLPACTLEKDPDLLSAIRRINSGMNPDSEEVYHRSVLWNQMGRSDAPKKKKLPLTAENIYRYLKTAALSEEDLSELSRLCFMDIHSGWKKMRSDKRSEAFMKITRRIRADLKSFSKDKNKSGSLSFNLSEAAKERFDYRQVLSRFATFSEDMVVSKDEFDYVYYMYGLEQYGNMPLIEPLEYCDEKKLREFVIVIDTSASCREGLLERFLRQTLSILKDTESFFTRVNIHILQCDNEVRSDTVINDVKNISDYAALIKAEGFGSTDFRPAFSYVQNLMEEKKLENPGGLVYFTDGYGTYPAMMPPYPVLFVFTDEDESRPPVPAWAMKVVLPADEEGE